MKISGRRSMNIAFRTRDNGRWKSRVVRNRSNILESGKSVRRKWEGYLFIEKGLFSDTDHLGSPNTDLSFFA